MVLIIIMIVLKLVIQENGTVQMNGNLGQKHIQYLAQMLKEEFLSMLTIHQM